MSGVLINLIIQIVAGAIGGNVAGGASKYSELGNGRQHPRLARLAAELADRFCRQ